MSCAPWLHDRYGHTHTHPLWGLWPCRPPNIIKCFSAFLNCNEDMLTSHLIPSQVAPVLTYPLWWRVGRDKWDSTTWKGTFNGAFGQPATHSCLQQMPGKREEGPGHCCDSQILEDLKIMSAEATSRWSWSLQILWVPKNWREWLKTGPESSLQEERGTWTCYSQLFSEQATSGK